MHLLSTLVSRSDTTHSVRCARHSTAGRCCIALQGQVARIALVVCALAAAAACGSGSTSPTGPSGPPGAGSTISYAAIGASDVTGVGSSVICPPFVDCPDGMGYVFVAARGMRARGSTVTVSNLGIPTGVISRSFQDLGTQLGRTVLGNFIDQEAPFVPRQATLVSIFAGANEVNVITSALGAGAGGTDPAGYVDQQVRVFGEDFTRLMNTVRARTTSARIVILNVPNVAGMPFLAGASLAQRQAAQRASVRMTTTVVNSLAASNVAVVDLMCDARLYDRASYSSDGFHPNDTGYALIGADIINAATSSSYPSPRGSCPQMSIVP